MDTLEPTTVIGVSLFTLGLFYGAALLKMIQRFTEKKSDTKNTPKKPGGGRGNRLPPFLMTVLRQPAFARSHKIQAGGYPISKPSHVPVEELAFLAIQTKKEMHNSYPRWKN